MTPERLGEIIAGGESLEIEFKGEEARPLSDNELVEALVCLANRPGERPGWLLVGVEKDGCITRRDAAELCQLAPNQARALLAPLTKAGKLALRAERRGHTLCPPCYKYGNIQTGYGLTPNRRQNVQTGSPEPGCLEKETTGREPSAE